MGVTVRAATIDDLDAMVRLTSRRRARLAEWSPIWWHPSPVADQLHPLRLQHLVASDEAVTRVVEYGGVVVGCAVSIAQGDQWFIDDVAIVSDVRWHDGGIILLESVSERPALTSVPCADDLFAAAARLLGLHIVSSYWTLPLAGYNPRPDREGTVIRVAAADELGDIEPGPQHTFGASLDPHDDGALLLVDDELGFIVGSPPSPAPPVYDPGGTVCIVDRVVGHQPALLNAAVIAAAGRGDVILTVVCGEADHELAAALAELGFTRTVNLVAWPDQ